jgi:hypothetical protein
LTWGDYIANRRKEHSLFSKIQKKNGLKIGLVDQKLFKFQLTRVWDFLTMPGTEKDIAFSQLAVKGLS